MYQLNKQTLLDWKAELESGTYRSIPDQLFQIVPTINEFKACCLGVLDKKLSGEVRALDHGKSANISPPDYPKDFNLRIFRFVDLDTEVQEKITNLLDLVDPSNSSVLPTSNLEDIFTILNDSAHHTEYPAYENYSLVIQGIDILLEDSHVI